MCVVVLQTSTLNQNVAEEDEHELPKEGSEDLVHESLKGGGRVRETKWHHEELIMTFVRLECRFCNVFYRHLHLMVPRYPECRPNLEKYFVPCNSSKRSSMRYKKLIFSSVVVQCTIIHWETSTTFRLPHQHHRRSERTRARATDSHGQHLVDLLLYLVHLVEWVSIRASIYCHCWIN